eukprot:TRINITY_DN454_c0_g1_i12.p3 TRINITY_DN454_c0_g1~~TRINITY_DN454_c0_g1_i12.p3  ORF type:complete len:158 (-),score=31.65 TRINITY_DN454_c0_g1_i12:696-1169(-)
MQAELSAAEKEKLTAFFNTCVLPPVPRQANIIRTKKRLDTNKNGLLSASELAVVGSKMNVQGVDKAKCQAFIDSCNNTKGESFDLAKFFFCAACVFLVVDAFSSPGRPPQQLQEWQREDTPGRGGPQAHGLVNIRTRGGSSGGRMRQRLLNKTVESP